MSTKTTLTPSNESASVGSTKTVSSGNPVVKTK